MKREPLLISTKRGTTSRVRQAGPQLLLTSIISLVRFAIGAVDALEPFDETVNRRFAEWLAKQQKAGRSFTPEQMNWLIMLKDHIATSLRVEPGDLELAPFHEKGGPIRAYQAFGEGLEGLLEELNRELVA